MNDILYNNNSLLYNINVVNYITAFKQVNFNNFKKIILLLKVWQDFETEDLCSLAL